MSQAKRKTTAAHWPSQYLVVCRTNLDELPLLVTPDRKLAHRYAKNVPEQDMDAAAEVMGVDRAGRVCIAVIWFRAGRPKRCSIVKDIVFGDE
jgi:hypothetical protein